MRHFKLFFYSLYGSIYIRILVGYIRWFYYYKVRKYYKSLDIDNAIEGTVKHNLRYFLKFPLPDFVMKRMDRLISMIKSIEIINDKSHFLIIGPRTESDIMRLKFNFPKAKINSIDIISYSPWIEIQDAHKTTFLNNSFDCIISGWVLKYSSNQDKMINEMVRIINNNGIIAIGIEYYKPETNKYFGNKDLRHLKWDELRSSVNSVKEIENILVNNEIKYRIISSYDALLKDKSVDELYEITGLPHTQVMVCIQIFK
jgi:hypothetical protein